MKKILFCLIVALLFSACAAKSKTILLGEKAPFTRFTLLDGSYRTTENYKGNYLLVVFWATTCARAHSTLDKVAEWERHNKGKRNLSIVTVNVDKVSREEKVRAALASLSGASIEHAFSGNDIYDEAYIAYDVGELPTLVLVDPTGKIIGSGDSIDVLKDAFPDRR